ncbi:MAG: CoA transferase [Desulfobacterales bacterium]|nr:CoA transferase [Desulfobacterales bacterium]
MDESTEKNYPLEGIKILEYAVFHAGPGAGAILGDIGADIIKIESGPGDPERYWTIVGNMDISTPNGESVMHEISNRNKKGIYLDITSEKGREIFLKLIQNTDVFLTNLRKTTKIKLGIDYQTLSKINPKIIHANVSGYGPDGPESDIGAFDPMGQARSGMMYLNDPNTPKLIHLAILDQATAIAASHAIITALFVRERTGKGQEVHVSLFATGLWLLYANLVTSSILGRDPSISWIRTKNSPLRNSFCCKDGKWIIGVHHPEEKYWETFCKTTGQEQLLNDTKFADKKARVANCEELINHFDKIIASKDRNEWLDIFVKHGLMFTPIQRVHDIFQDKQSLINEYIKEFSHPLYGDIKLPGYPIHFSEGKTGTRMPAPSIGQHTYEILQDIGYTVEQIDDLKKENIIK